MNFVVLLFMEVEPSDIWFTLVFGLERDSQFPIWFHQNLVSNTDKDNWFPPKTWHISLTEYSIKATAQQIQIALTDCASCFTGQEADVRLKGVSQYYKKYMALEFTPDT